MRLSPEPGSFAWLAANETRINWRRFTGMFAHLPVAKALPVGLFLIVLLHAAAWPAVVPLAGLIEAVPERGEGALVMLAVSLSILAWMVSQGMLGAARALFDRGDLELLLSAPIPPSRVLAARASAIAASSLGSVAVLTLPVAHTGALLGHPQMLAAYPVLLSLSLIGTGIGLAAAMGLFRMVGARRARMVCGLAAAAMAGVFVLAVQIVALLPDAARSALIAWVRASGLGAIAEGPGLWLTADAMAGEPAAMLSLLVLALAIFLGALAVLAGPFAGAVLAAAGAPSPDHASARRKRRDMRFTTGAAAALRLKEWRLILRDPHLFAQIALQIVYTVPVALVMVRSGANIPIAIVAAPVIVVIAAQLAASIAWIAVSGEDAPELIAAAPVERAAVDRAKLSAVAAPVLVVVGLPLALLAWLSPVGALVGLLCAAAASASTALVNLWHPMPGNRRGLLRRHQQSKVVAMVEHGLSLLWALAVVMALMGTWLAVLPVALACGVLAMAHPAARAAAARPSVAGDRVAAAQGA